MVEELTAKQVLELENKTFDVNIMVCSGTKLLASTIQRDCQVVEVEGYPNPYIGTSEKIYFVLLPFDNPNVSYRFIETEFSGDRLEVSIKVSEV